MRACGLAGYRNDGDFAIGRYLRDILSSPIMINNDRILANAEAAVLGECAGFADATRRWGQRTNTNKIRPALMNVAFKEPKPALGRHRRNAAVCRSGIDGVYARTGAFENVVEALGGPDLAPSRTGRRSVAISRQ